ncbi:MAG: winged helix-turn-helix transcriptional regulator [Zestosphaera sp.]
MKLIEPEFLEALYRVRAVGKFQIAKELASILNEDLRSVLMRINNLLKIEYLWFSTEYSLRALGLKLMIIVTDKNLLTEPSAKFMKFIRATAYVFPDKYFYSLYIPKDAGDVSIPSKLLEGAVIMEFHERLRNRTSFTRYGIDTVFSPEKGFSRESFKRLEMTVRDFMVKQSAEARNSDDRLSKIVFDAVDLGIIKELEKNPFAKQSEIARALGVSLGKLRRHAANHVPYLVKGIRLMCLPIYPAALGTALVMRIKSRSSKDVVSLCEALVTHPVVVSCGYNVSDGSSLAQFIVPFSMVRHVAELFESIGREYGFEVSRDAMWLANIEFGKRFTLPYKRWEEYVPKMSWNVDELRRIFGGFGGKGN